MNRLDKEARKADKIATMDPEQLADYLQDNPGLGEATLDRVFRRSIENQARVWRILRYLHPTLLPPRTL